MVFASVVPPARRRMRSSPSSWRAPASARKPTASVAPVWLRISKRALAGGPSGVSARASRNGRPGAGVTASSPVAGTVKAALAGSLAKLADGLAPMQQRNRDAGAQEDAGDASRHVEGSCGHGGAYHHA